MIGTLIPLLVCIAFIKASGVMGCLNSPTENSKE